ncbi:hypothetical protein H0E87_014569 [Populus deltoides]|uniref:RRM domain-containing protein n=1 Tax=Populus deltoides TaxID=3696 RepID=A0A8T2YE32_POPDE|nr:hypothetical protein H0E87_014569 [Populus deltoides]
MEENMAAYYPPPPPPPGHYPTYYQTQPPPPTVAPIPPPPPHHLPYIPHPQPPPAPFVSYVSVPAYVPHDQVRTLFVAGLPDDIKPREMYNLFREFPGYESSHLRTPSQNSQPFAFATFTDQPSAVAAMHALNGMVFDLEKGSTLYIDLAKSNSRSKRSRTDDEWSSLDKKARVSSGFSMGTPDSGFGSVHLPGMANSAFNTIGFPSAQSPGSIDDRSRNESKAGRMNNSSAPPCPTLFVANLGQNCTEEELIQVFSRQGSNSRSRCNVLLILFYIKKYYAADSFFPTLSVRCPGFLKLKMQSTYGAPVAFVDFQDTASSTGALNHLQGTVLYSSVAGEGLRLEYAKSRMGMRRKPR